MKKSKNILAIGILSLTYISPITSVADTELPVSTSNEDLIKAKNMVNEEGLRGILAGSVEYSANATEFSTGDQYTGTIHLTNTAGNTISAETKIIVAIPPADNKPGHKEDTPKTEPSSSTHDVLPETGENEKMTFISIV